jgi:uncharacterized RDD family membrane protein YckC
MAAITVIPLNRTGRLAGPARRHSRRLVASIAAGAALMLAAAVALTLVVAVSRGAPANGYRTGTSAVVPHPAPGPYGS